MTLGFLLVSLALSATLSAAMIRRWHSLAAAAIVVVTLTLMFATPADMGAWLRQVAPLAIGLTLASCAASWAGRKLIAQDSDGAYRFRFAIIALPLLGIGVNILLAGA